MVKFKRIVSPSEGYYGYSPKGQKGNSEILQLVSFSAIDPKNSWHGAWTKMLYLLEEIKQFSSSIDDVLSNICCLVICFP